MSSALASYPNNFLYAFHFTFEHNEPLASRGKLLHARFKLTTSVVSSLIPVLRILNIIFWFLKFYWSSVSMTGSMQSSLLSPVLPSEGTGWVPHHRTTQSVRPKTEGIPSTEISYSPKQNDISKIPCCTRYAGNLCLLNMTFSIRTDYLNGGILQIWCNPPGISRSMSIISECRTLESRRSTLP